MTDIALAIGLGAVSALAGVVLGLVLMALHADRQAAGDDPRNERWNIPD